MRKGLTELVFILDRSGSMSGLESDTTGGFNSMIERQKKEKGEAYVSTVLFDDVSEVIHDRVNIADVRELSDRDYYVRGCTALLDAVGRAVHHIETVHRYARSEDVPEKTVFVITTDGLENASREYTYDKVRTMISKKQEMGWDSMFLGANIDAVGEAAKIGIPADRAVRYECDSEGIAVNFSAVSSAVTMSRGAGLKGASWKDSIEEDYRRRGRKK